MEHQVIRLVKRLLAMLPETGVIPIPQLKRNPGTASDDQGPVGLIVQDFLRNERFYLANLETLLDMVERVTSWRRFYVFKQLLSPIRPLVNVERQFLMTVEALAHFPYSIQSWHTAFQEWSQNSGRYYAAVINAERELRLTISGDPVQRNRCNYDGVLHELMPYLTLSSRWIEKYEIFLQVCTQVQCMTCQH